MRKVELTMKEEYKYQVIKKLVETDGNKNNAALRLGCTQRAINRMINGYRKEGKAFFRHGNKGREPANAIDQGIRQEILTLYDNKYSGGIFTHVTEKLAGLDGIKMSKSSLRALLLEEGILSPLATHQVKKRFKQQLELEKKHAKSKKEQKRSRTNCSPRRQPSS